MGEVIKVSNGRFMIHESSSCIGLQTRGLVYHCPFHYPSDHGMSEWPIVIRETTLVERLCEHGVGHPDPDSVKVMTKRTGQSTWEIHGCDGCCWNGDDNGTDQ